MTTARWDGDLDDVLATVGAHADFGERHGSLAPESVAALRDSGLLRLWRPRSLGGYEVSPRAYTELAEAVARRDTAAAWLMMVSANTTFDLRLASAALVEEIFGANADAVVCETFNRPMQAAPVDGGYTVTGSTPFASGCRHADWIGHTALAGDRLLLLFHPAAALTIEDDWDTLGLRGTSSNTIRADHRFVPAHRVIEFGAPRAPNGHFGGPLYRLPEGILTATFPPVALGALSAALEATDDVAENKVPFASGSALKHRQLAQLHYGRALGAYRAARALLHQELDGAWQRVGAGETFSRRHKADLFLACAFALQSSADAVSELARGVGTTGIYRRSPLERAFRDLQVIRHHAFGAEARFATVAQAYWGLEVDFPLLEMD
jgi:alkylation response protein AidB-like acyl-CoA dehydrogenase